MSLLRQLLDEKRKSCAVEAARVENLLSQIANELTLANIQFTQDSTKIVIQKKGGGRVIYVQVQGEGFLCSVNCFPPAGSPMPFCEMIRKLAEII